MLQTERPNITPLNDNDLKEYIINGYGEAKTSEDIVEVINNVLIPHERAKVEDKAYHTIWAVTNSDNSLVGEIGFKGKKNEFGIVEIAYYVAPKYRDQGYCTEMTEAILEWATNDERAIFVVASIAPDNEPSKKIARKTG